MSQDPRSPTRQSTKQTKTVCKHPVTTKEAPTAEHVRDPNATPRPTRPKRAASQVLPIPDLHTSRAPVLRPSVFEEHADRGMEDLEVESTHKSTTSKRSRSPTRRMVDLQIAKKPVVPKRATSSADVPQDEISLYKAIQALARF
jgi:hypothetical protein